MRAYLTYTYICTACEEEVAESYEVPLSASQVPLPAAPPGWRVWHCGSQIGALYCPAHALHLTMTVDGHPHEVPL
jgi:hypothetical protein